MEAFLSQMVGTLLSELGEHDKPPEHEIDHYHDKVCICCGTLNVAEYGEHEKDSDQAKNAGDTFDDDD